MTRSRTEPTIFELVELTYRFIRYELIHAGVAVIVFGVIFLIFRPWNNSYYTDDVHTFWFVGPPLIYFSLDLLFAMFLHFTLRNDLKPKCCLIWVFGQLANLILLTTLGFYMTWTYYYRGSTYLRLSIALIVLYLFKAYRISQMHKLIIMMRNRSQMTATSGFTVPNNFAGFNANHQNQQKVPYIIPTIHVHTVMTEKPPRA